MGVSGLMTYIKDHSKKVASTVDLVRLADQKRTKDPTGAGKALLLCDYAAVVRVLETIILEKQPKYCSYYGCDTRLLSLKFESFIKSLRSIGVEPVFFSDGPADEEGFEAKFEARKERQVQKLERSRKWEEAVRRPKNETPENLPHPLCYTVCDYVLQEHKVKCLVSSCEADIVLIDYCKTRPNALGILSNDTDFAIADGCQLLPLDCDFFDFRDAMGFFGENKCRVGIAFLPCRYITCRTLAKCLNPHMRKENMPWFAMLLGNDYTRQYAYDVRRQFCIQERDKAKRIDRIVQWICQGNAQQMVWGKEFEGFNKACQFSKRLYSGELQYTIPKDVIATKLSVVFLSLERGMYWQQPVAEAPSLKLPLPYAVSQPIRSIAYALFGHPEVTEYGHRSCESDGSLQVHGQDLRMVREALQCRGVFARAAALHHLVNIPLHSLDQQLMQSAAALEDLTVKITEQEVLRGIIAVSTLTYLVSVKGLELEKNEIRGSLLALAATTAGVRGDINIGQPNPDPFLRAVSLSSTISVSLLSLYYIAELLDLAPKASDIFCSSVFVPAYMAAMHYLPARIPSLDPVVHTVHSPHTAELMGCIRTMGHMQGKHKVTLSSSITLAAAVRHYTAVVGEMRALV